MKSVDTPCPLSAAASFDCSGLSLICSANPCLPPESSRTVDAASDCLAGVELGVAGVPPLAVFLLLMLTNTVGRILHKGMLKEAFHNKFEMANYSHCAPEGCGEVPSFEVSWFGLQVHHGHWEPMERCVWVLGEGHIVC